MGLQNQPTLETLNISRKIFPWLVAILFLRLVGFSTISDSAAIAKVLKTGIGLAMTTLILFIFFRLIKKGFIPSFRYQHVLAILLYSLYLSLGLLSLVWTSDVAVSALQITRDIEMLVFSFFFIYIIVMLNHYYPQHYIRISAIIAPAIILNLSIFLIGNIVAPDIFIRKTHGGEVSRLGGQMMNPNELGMLCGVAIACCFAELKQKANLVWNVIMILIALYALFITGSRSSMIGFFLVAMYYVIISKSYTLKATVVAVGILVMPIVVNVIFLKEGAKTSGTSGAEEVLSMTGRLPFWEALLTEGLPNEPLLGFGFMRINYTTYFQGAHTYPAAMTHNTFIQVLMNLGFIGFLVVLLQMSFMIRAIIKVEDKVQKELIFTMLIPILINSFTEFGIWGEVNYSILLYQLIILTIVIRYNNRFNVLQKIIQRKKLNIQ
ncbi:O-antigen ligase family protein [Flavobacterium sp.]|uniref:O-antigen ligase family protein n=1 Tax=Flavobacterium sp. TaxID=239 RepID=UPI0025BEEC43|nr:O-antigen ligase family protein [Flavobacterium sp.]